MVLEEMGTRLVEPLNTLVMAVLDALPGLVGGIVVLVVGWIVAAVIARLVHRGLDAAKLESLVLERSGLRKATGTFDLNGFLALITKWFVFVPFLASSAELMNLMPISTFLNILAAWIPNAIGAVVIALFGFVEADYIAAKIEATRLKSATLLASAAHWLVLIMVTLVILDQVGLHVGVVKDSFNIILAGVMLGFAIAVGIGYGDALKETAKKSVKSLRR